MTYGDIFRSELNPAQLDAVNTLSGPLLILAGAGSGKTRAITYRFVNLVLSGSASPGEILSVTFTNKAARNMEARVADLLAKQNIALRERLWISTFHSTCVRILREHIHLLEYKNHFNIYDSGDQLNMIKKVITGMNLNDKIYPPKSLQYSINQAKLNAQTPDDLFQKSKSAFDKTTAEVYRTYEEEMKRSNCLDFDDLLVKTLDLFKSYPDILELYQEKFRYIMVDEYQDTNRVQYLIVKMLAEKHQNLCVVGDEDQSIYSWRGADIRNILDFEKDFPNAKIIKLEENYRSTETIVKATTHLIANNTQRKNKVCFTSNSAGELITVKEEGTEYDEARFVTREIQTLVQQGESSYKDFAIFYRTNAQSRVLEEQLNALTIPYKLVGGMRFYERMEIKDMISYLKLILNPNDDMAFTRVVNVPVRGIGKTTLEKIAALAAEKKLTLFEASLYAIDTREFNVGTTRKLRVFTDLIESLQRENEKASPLEAYLSVLDKTQYIEFLKTQDSFEAQSRIENLDELNNAIDQFQKERGEEASLQSFLEEMALVSDLDSVNDEANTVTMMTLHISKGLEFPFVFIVGMEENLFPGQKSSASLDPTEMEEERRLAYVGMTRAEKKLFLTYARERRVWGQAQRNIPSRFIEELPQEYIDMRGSARRPKFMDRIEPTSSMEIGRRTPSRVSKNWQDESFESGPSYEDFNQESGNSIIKGARVRHPTFGVGIVYETEGKGEQQKVSVLFDSKLLKKFVVKFARLERV